MTLTTNDEARLTTVDIVSEVLAAIFGATQEPIFFQTLANDPGDTDEAPIKKSILTRDVPAIARFIGRHDRNRRGLFYCISTIALGSSTRNKDNTREIVAVWTDLDFRSIAEDEPAIRKVIDTLPIPPSAIVFSGGGLHLYWLLKEPLDAQVYRERLEALNRKLASVLAGDLQATDVCRLMRLPGTVNSKHGDVRVVKVERLDADRRYDFDELEEAVAEWAPGRLTVKEAPVRAIKAGRKGATPVPAEGGSNPFLAVAEAQGWKPPLDVEQALASMTYPGNVHDTQIRVAASLAKAGVDRADAVQTILDATQAVVGTAGWDWKAEEKAIGGHYDSAVAKFDVRPVSRETPKTSEGFVESPVTVAGKGAEVRSKKRKQPTAQATHIVLARTVLEVLENDGYRLLFTETGPYAYETGLWTLRDDKDLAGWLNAALEEGAQGMGVESTSRLINEARAYIIRQPRLQGRETVFDNHGKVPTKSGLVDPVTGELDPASSDHLCTWRVPFDYDPAAACPYWLQMLEDTFADRPPAVRAEYVQLLQEWLGMSLLDNRAKALSCILFFQGGSDYGKSEIIDVLSGVFGRARNTTPIDQLDNPHGLMAFARRVPWVLPEAFQQGKWHFSSVTKALASGEPIQINMKRGAIFDHTFTGPIIWGANSGPQFKESSAAMTNRLLIVPCHRKFDPLTPVGVALVARAQGLDKPSHLIMRDEMPGVLAWGVQGLLRARARGYFLRPEESRIAAENVRRDTNIALGFIEDCVTFDFDDMVSVPDFAAAFASWWAEGHGNERGVPGSESISKAMKSLADPRIAFDLKDNSRRYYAGINLNAEGMRYWSNAVTSDAFLFQSRKASTTDSGGNPNKPIPAAWSGKSVIQAMRAAQAKSVTVVVTVFPGDVPLPSDSGKLSPLIQRVCVVIAIELSPVTRRWAKSCVHGGADK
jgi:hypothetical protein